MVNQLKIDKDCHVDQSWICDMLKEYAALAARNEFECSR